LLSIQDQEKGFKYTANLAFWLLQGVKYFRYQKNSGDVITNEFSTKMNSAENSILVLKKEKEKEKNSRS